MASNYKPELISGQTTNSFIFLPPSKGRRHLSGRPPVALRAALVVQAPPAHRRRHRGRGGGEGVNGEVRLQQQHQECQDQPAVARRSVENVL